MLENWGLGAAHCYSDQSSILLFGSIDSVHLVLILLSLQLLWLCVTENFTNIKLGLSSYFVNKQIACKAVNNEVTTTVYTKLHQHKIFKGIQNIQLV